MQSDFDMHTDMFVLPYIVESPKHTLSFTCPGLQSVLQLPLLDMQLPLLTEVFYNLNCRSSSLLVILSI